MPLKEGVIYTFNTNDGGLVNGFCKPPLNIIPKSSLARSYLNLIRMKILIIRIGLVFHVWVWKT
jgi:hypothetical protein